MVRLRLALTIVGVLFAASAAAQPGLYTGMLTAHIGAAAGGGVGGTSVTPGASMSVTDGNGVGTELDIGNTRDIDDAQFLSSGVTSFTVNALGMWPKSWVRPFVVAGVGLLRVRAELADTNLDDNRTDWAFDVGGGVLFMLNDIFGVRGDVRYFRYMQRQIDLPVGQDGAFDYWRTSIGFTYAWPIR